MSIATTVWDSYAAWREAGRPVGGVIPVDRAERDKYPPEAWPDRYRAVREMYWVALPGGQLWCPWQKAYNAEHGYHGNGWDVSGPPERLTTMPSIQTAAWHGYLKDGQLDNA